MIDPGRVAYEEFVRMRVLEQSKSWTPWEALPRQHQDAWRAAGVKVLSYASCVEAEEKIEELTKERDELIAANVKREADIERIAAEVSAECKNELAREKELESRVEALSRTLLTVKELIRPPQTYVQDIDLINASKEIEKALREQSR